MIPINYSVRSLVGRRATSFATAFGIALVVFVLASSMMLVSGIKKTLATGGRAENAILLRKGAEAELMSYIDDTAVSIAIVQPAVMRDGNSPMAVAELVQVTQMEKLGAGGFSNVTLRGVPDNAMKFRPDMKVVEGQMPHPGSNEVMVGQRIAGRFKGLSLGDTFDFRKNRPAKVVGIFEDRGSVYESEVWADRDVMRTAFGRTGVVSSVRVRLQSPEAFDGFKAAVESDKRLEFEVLREQQFFETQSAGLAKLMGGLGGAISVCFSIGAMIGAMITMYGAVANRQREIGTLRALGFARTSILFSFLAESVMLTLLGGVVGALASLVMGLVKFSMLNATSWSEVVFTFDPTPQILLRALFFAGVMGLLGGLFPAIRASRVSPVAAMRG